MRQKLTAKLSAPGLRLRSMSTGRAAAAMEPLKYAPVPAGVRKTILEELA